MDALIIAAGFGSRLAALSPSKPLTPVAGVPLLELGVRQAAAAGARKVVVVTGHEAERVEAFLPDLAARVGVPVEAARVADWSKPNGWSVLAGAERIAGDYLLMMADHVFAAQLLAGLADAGRAQTHDVGSGPAAWWMDVDDPRAHALAEQLAPRYLPECYPPKS